MSEELKLYFSVVSGELYKIAEDEVKHLDETQIPLLKMPKSNCKKCHGRFYTGRQAFHTPTGWQQGSYIPCARCARHCVDFDSLKTEEIDVKKLTVQTESV